METEAKYGRNRRGDLDRIAAEAEEKSTAKLKASKTLRAAQLRWHQIVKSKFPEALPDVWDMANLRRLENLQEAWGRDRMFVVMRFGVQDWKALRQIPDRKFDLMEEAPNFRQFYMNRDRIAARYSASLAREREWREQQKKSRDELMEIQKSWEETKGETPGLVAFKKVMQELQEKLQKRAS